MSKREIIRVEKLSSKSKNKYVYKDIDFTIYEGEIVGLLGHNGAGKSTMQRVISNMEQPQEGEVFIDGKKSDINENSNKIILIPDTIEIFKNLTINENMSLLSGIYKYNKEFFQRHLKNVSLTGDTKVLELSKGNQEIAQLIMYLSLEVEVYMLDEPFSAVDIFRREFIQKLILDVYTRNEDVSFIITTHLIAEIQDILTRVIYLNDGEISFDMQMEEIEEEGQELIDYLKDHFSERLGYEFS